MVKSTQTVVTYPRCSFCGGMKNSKSSAKRKVVLGQLSLYTNSSESFIVWCKKHDEPKGQLWLRSCCVRKGQEGAIELISRGCRGRCSYTLKFAVPSASEEWYRLLRQESRRVPTIGDDELAVYEDIDDSTSLDSILTDMTPSLEYAYSSENDENYGSDEVDSLSPSQPPTPNSKSKKQAKLKSKVKSSPILCNPLHGLRGTGSRKSISSSSVQTILPFESYIENTPEDLSRWSWPLKV